MVVKQGQDRPPGGPAPVHGLEGLLTCRPSDLRRGPRQSREQPALSRIGRTQENVLPRALARNAIRDAALLFRAFRFASVAGFADLRLELGLEFLAGFGYRSFLRNDPKVLQMMVVKPVQD